MTAFSLFATDTSATPANIIAAARALAPHLARSRTLDRRLVSNTMTLCFGGSDAEGAWKWRDAYDAIEIALVLQMRRLAPQIGRVEDAPAEIAAMLTSLTALTLTHTRRSEEQVEMDQFSTPPALAALAIAAAQVRPGDLVLEPSAGTGLLAVCAEACGARVELNELSDHRAALLDGLFQACSRTRYDAATLPDRLPSSGSFGAVVTNPPFQKLAAHLIAAVKVLADGGRMVAIVPTRAFEDKDLLASLAAHGEVVAMLCFPSRAYAKHGTSVATGLLIVDRVPAGEARCAVQSFEDFADLGKAITALRPRANAQARTFRQVAATALLQPRERAIAGPSGRLAFLATAARVEYETKPWSGEGRDVGIYQSYDLGRIRFPTERAHPSALVESAPMASVAPPAPTYRPVLPAPIIDSGLVSDPQLETTVYAGEAHSRMLPGWWVKGDAAHDIRLAPEGADGAFQFRCGFFIGDATGVGKGREISAIIADNMSQGRLRAVWVPKNDALLEDARRDWKGIGGGPSDITPQSAWKQSEAIRMEKGILFTTYGTLRQPARGTKKSRLEQITDWLGADFDGVILFDEAHEMANAAGGGNGSRGPKKASLQGQAGLALQNQLPSARIVYVSATGATTPENLAYAQRLGLWGGPEASFNTREAFLEACEKGGVATMELVARELKAMGLYMARSLSFDGVEYEPLRHELTEENIAIWDAWADAFQIIHAHLAEALKAIGIVDGDGKTVSGQHKSAVMSAFESSKQRFFSHLLAGMKAPTVAMAIRESLANDCSAIVQIVSTNEAVMERRLAQIPTEEWNNLTIDLTPKEYVLDYLANAFPVMAMAEVIDEDENVTLEPLRNEDGTPVVCQEAVALRDQLVTELACLPAVPGALDAIIDLLGSDNVAEVTGRGRRVVLKDGRRVVERRGASANKAETDAFMTGRKRVLIFSNAGGTGRSYHADLSQPNHQKRHHFLVEPGWRADAAVQGLGRSHRTNQACPPLFRPVTTDIQGEKRFLSTIARRLDSLGALTRGERRTAGNGMFSADDNLESPWAYRALRHLYSNIVWGEAACMKLGEFELKTGLRLVNEDGTMRDNDDLPPMNTFLNRLLALRIADQNAIFKDLDQILQSILEQAASSGALDRGVEDIAADNVEITSEEVLRTDTVTGAETRVLTAKIKVRKRILTSAEVLDITPQDAREFYINKRSGAAAVIETGLVRTDEEGRMHRAVRIWRPDRPAVSQTVADFKETAWTEAPYEIWLATWDAEAVNVDPFDTREIALVTGMLLPIWQKLPDRGSYVRRLKAPDGRRWLGRTLDPLELPKLKVDLGLTDVATITSDGAEVMKMIMQDGAELELSGGFWLRRVRVMDLYRIEVVNGRTRLQEFKLLGGFVEIIQHTPRVFCSSPESLTRILAKWPASRIVPHKQAA